MEEVIIRLVQPADREEWLRLRLALFPEHTREEMLAEMDQMLAESETTPVFVAQRAGSTRLGGFLEGGTRKYADGCDTSPVGYIEAWYVDADLRRGGVGGRLVRAMEEWARAQGLSEVASDTWLENQISIDAHKALGYMETERLVLFAKKL